MKAQSGTDDALDRGVLGKVPWSWCSLPTIYMHLGVFGKPTEEARILESLGRLVSRKAVDLQNKGLGITKYKRLKEG